MPQGYLAYIQRALLAPLSSILSILALVAFSLTGAPTKSYAAIAPLVVAPCSTCETPADLAGAAGQYFNTWWHKIPPGYAGGVGMSGVRYCSEGIQADGTIVLVVSSAVPISQRFWFCEQHGTAATFKVMPAGSSDATGVITYDSLKFARSAKTGKITLPPSIPIVSTPEIISQYLSSTAVPQIAGSQKTSIWHAILSYPQLLSADFYNRASNITFKLWNNDTITVTDSNGWTAKFRWTPMSTIQWVLVPDSIRDQNGNAPAQGSSPAQTINRPYLQPAAQLTITLPYGVQVVINPSMFPLPHGQITVGNFDSGTGVGGGSGGIGGGTNGTLLEIPN